MQTTYSSPQPARRQSRTLTPDAPVRRNPAAIIDDRRPVQYPAVLQRQPDPSAAAEATAEATAEAEARKTTLNEATTNYENAAEIWQQASIKVKTFNNEIIETTKEDECTDIEMLVKNIKEKSTNALGRNTGETIETFHWQQQTDGSVIGPGGKSGVDLLLFPKEGKAVKYGEVKSSLTSTKTEKTTNAGALENQIWGILNRNKPKTEAKASTDGISSEKYGYNDVKRYIHVSDTMFNALKNNGLITQEDKNTPNTIYIINREPQKASGETGTEASTKTPDDKPWVCTEEVTEHITKKADAARKAAEEAARKAKEKEEADRKAAEEAARKAAAAKINAEEAAEEAPTGRKRRASSRPLLPSKKRPTDSGKQ